MASSNRDSYQAQQSPDATPYPFVRLISVLFAGLLINAAHLARKFRRLLGLGVFTNWYAVVFLLFGVGICGIPVTSERTLRSLPHLESVGPYVADLSGIALTLFLTVVRFRSRARSTGDIQVRDFEDEYASNPVVAVLENGICERILERMQFEITAASTRYDWDVIKQAADNALEEEMVIRPLRRGDYDSARLSIKAFRGHSNARQDSINKYQALLRLLRWCSFRRLLRSLDSAEKERQR